MFLLFIVVISFNGVVDVFVSCCVAKISLDSVMRFEHIIILRDRSKCSGRFCAIDQNLPPIDEDQSLRGPHAFKIHFILTRVL